MSMLYRNELSRTGLKRGVLFGAMVLGLAQAALAATPTTTAPPLILSGRQSARPTGGYSAGISEIMKMLDAKIDAPVIMAYVQNSTIPYNPEATELIALKAHGASTEVLMALLHRGDEVRLQLAQARSAASPPVAAPAYEYAPEAAYPAYPYGSPDASDEQHPAADDGYSNVWPLAYWPSIPIDGGWPYRYARGRSPAHHGDSHPPGEGKHRSWAGAAPKALDAPQSVFAPSVGHMTSAGVHSGGWRCSQHSGGRSGGRSR